MPDPRIPIIADALLQEWRAEFVARPFEAVAARVVEALDRAAPVPAADQVEIVARAREAFSRAAAEDGFEEPDHTFLNRWLGAAVAAISAAPRVTEVSDAMVNVALTAFYGHSAATPNTDSAEMMRTALSAALAAQDREAVADGLRACADAVVKAWNGMTPGQDPAEELWQPMHDLSNALRPTPPPAESVSGWQPIATAPRDGQFVMLWWSFVEKCPQVARWSSCRQRWAVVGAEGSNWRVGPTHWRPLPDPPLPTVEPGGGE